MNKEIKKTEFNLCMEKVQGLELIRIKLYNKIYIMTLQSLVDKLTSKQFEHPKALEKVPETLKCFKLIPENLFQGTLSDYSCILNKDQIDLFKVYPQPNSCIELQEAIQRIESLSNSDYDFYLEIDSIIDIKVTLNALIRKLKKVEEEILSIESFKIAIEVFETTVTDPLLDNLNDILQS